MKVLLVAAITVSVSVLLMSFSDKIGASANTEGPNLTIMAHVQTHGWMGPYGSGDIVGNVGYSSNKGGWIGTTDNGTVTGGGVPKGKVLNDKKRLEAVKIQLEGIPGASIEYRAHSQSYGWLPWVRDGQMAGTEGQAKRLEAIEIRLVNAPGWGVRYRARVQSSNDLVGSVGKVLNGSKIPTVWHKWVKDGQRAGTVGQRRRVSHLQIQLYRK